MNCRRASGLGLCRSDDARNVALNGVSGPQGSNVAEAPKNQRNARAEKRQQRLAAELRANLAKRKAQSRARLQPESQTGGAEEGQPGET